MNFAIARVAGLILFAWPLCGQSVVSEPYVPDDDASVLERLATRPADAGAIQALYAQQRALAARPDDLALALDFARRAIERGRAEGDPRWHGRAEAALRPWLKASAPPPAVRLLRATLRQQRHDFAGALLDLDALIRQRPDDLQARLTRATVLLVQGRPAAALPDCNALAAARRNLLAAAVCLASVRGLDGHLDAAAETLAGALAASAQAPAGERRWAWTTLAELEARRGRPDLAEQAFLAALALIDAESGGGDPYLLAARADFLLATGRADAARTLTAPHRAIDNLMLRHALALAALADPALPAAVAELDARFTESRLRGEAGIHKREEALYWLALKRDPVRALALAVDNWSVQRQPIDARLLLVAAQAAEAPAAAEPVRVWLQETGIEDAELHALAAAR